MNIAIEILEKHLGYDIGLIQHAKYLNAMQEYAEHECKELRDHMSRLQPFTIGSKVWFWHQEKQKPLCYKIEHMDVHVRTHAITIGYKLENGSASAYVYNKVFATKEELLSYVKTNHAIHT